MTTIGIHEEPRVTRSPEVRGTLQAPLLLAGILSSITYVAFDLIAAARYPGYSLPDQAISELSAVGAPTAPLWAFFGPIYAVLLVAFAVGVLRAGRGNGALRRTGWILLAFVAWGMLWPFFPMHPRGTQTGTADLGHLVLGAGSSLIIIGFIVSGAFALGRQFRAWSLATALLYFVTSIATFGYVSRVAAGAPTPGLGLVERVMIYSYLLWIAVLAASLLRGDRASSKVGVS
jgi:hypothetical membrane protein